MGRERRERVLEFGTGSGRNRAAIEAAGFAVAQLESATESAHAALSTHALLHGTPSEIDATLQRIASLLGPHSPLYATFGSVRDARYGMGALREPFVFAPEHGDEAGVDHSYFDGTRLRAMLEPQWAIESMREVPVDEIAGTWAHQTTPLQGAVHWFVIATKR